MPLPKPDTTPPVIKMNFAIMTSEKTNKNNIVSDVVYRGFKTIFQTLFFWKIFSYGRTKINTELS